MSQFLILLGGDLTVTKRLKQQIKGSRVLAADSGMRHAAILGVEPELWLGDFDSTDAALSERYHHVPRQEFPVAKNMTDGELALHEAYARGATQVILAGAFGGERTDHTLLHLSMATAQAESGRRLFLTSGLEEATPIVGDVSAKDRIFDLPDGTLFSLIGFTELVGLTLSGAKWPLQQVTVPFGSSLTLSNSVKGKLSVGLDAGLAVLIATLTDECLVT